MSSVGVFERSTPIDSDLERQRLVRAMKASGFPWPFDRNTGRAVWEDVLECRVVFVKYECVNGHRVARPKSCGFPVCPNCMPTRLRADFTRHLAELPERLALFLIEPPKEIVGRTKIGEWFRKWRRRTDLTAGLYGVRLRVGRPDVLLVLPADMVPAQLLTDPRVTLVSADIALNDAIGWYQQMFLEEIASWKTPEEMLALVAEVKGRRRFQGFGKYYAQKPTEKPDAQLLPEEPKKLHRASGGSAKGGSKALSCPICGAKMRMVGIALSEEGLKWNPSLKVYLWGTGPPPAGARDLPVGLLR